MAIPSFDKFIDPVLRYLAAQPEGAKAGEVHDAAAEALGLTAEEREELLSSGNYPVYKNRAAWAHDRLKRHGLSNSPKRGWWQLTPKGLDYVAKHPKTLSYQEAMAIAWVARDSRLRPAEESPNGENDQVSTGATATPDERIQEAITEIRETVAQDLLDTLATVSPSFFERVVLDVLHSMGYGASKDDLKKVGGSGDGGIDGVISLDKLGLEKVYIQAKRWQSPVGRPEVQGFYGALAGLRARKGVFITTSSFTQQALDFAKSAEGFVLVDGKRLAQLMIDHGVGVSLRAIQLPRLDTDYFDGEGA